MSDKRKDPFGSFRFKVEVDGIVVGGFQEVTGLSIETEVETITEGGLNHQEYKLVKRSKYSDLTLKRGLSDVSALWAWYRMVLEGKTGRRNLSVLLMDTSGNTKLRWDFTEAFPIKWEGPALNASTTAISTESIVIAHQGLLKASKV